MTAHPTLGYLEGIIPHEITAGYHIIMTLTKVVQIEFGRRPLSSLQKDGRITVAKTKATKARTAGKAASKKQTKRKAAEVEDKAKEDLDSEGDDLSDELEESKVVYIREKAPAIKKQKAKNMVEIVVPKRNMRLAAKKV
jgi:hypothetical protein